MDVPTQRVDTLRVMLKFAAALRRRTKSKSAGFHHGANLEPLSTPLQDGIRFLLIPLPSTPWPLLARGLPAPCGVGDA